MSLAWKEEETGRTRNPRSIMASSHLAPSPVNVTVRSADLLAAVKQPPDWLCPCAAAVAAARTRPAGDWPGAAAAALHVLVLISALFSQLPSSRVHYVYCSYDDALAERLSCFSSLFLVLPVL